MRRRVPGRSDVDGSDRLLLRDLIVVFYILLSRCPLTSSPFTGARSLYIPVCITRDV